MYGPIGSAEVTMADPLRGQEGRTFPSVLLTFGTLVLRVGWYNHGDSVQSTGVLYGTIEGDLVCQLLDISTGTPVLVQRAVKPMRPIYGDFPGDGFRLKGVKLDATRALITWDNGYSQPMIVVSVSGSTVTFGDPVDVGGYITPTFDDGRARWIDPATGNTGILHDSVRVEDLITLESGQAGFVSTARVYHVVGDGSTWKLTRMGCLITTSGLVITGYRWWYLDAGFVRFTYPEHGDTLSACMGLGGLALVFVGQIATSASTGDVRIYRVDFTGASTTSPATFQERVFPRSAFPINATTDGAYMVLADSVGYVLVPLDDPINGAIEQVGPGATAEMYYAPFGTSWQHFLEPLRTPRGWLGITTEPGIDLNELRRVGPASIQVTGPLATLDTTPPEAGSTLYGATAMMAGTRYCVAMVDFELNVEPFNYREFMYVYEPIRQSEIEKGVRRGAFLQVRSGVS